MSTHSKCFFLWRNKKYHHRIITKYSSDNVGKRKWWLLHVGTIKLHLVQSGQEVKAFMARLHMYRVMLNISTKKVGWSSSSLFAYDG